VHRDLVEHLFARYREPVYRFLRRVLCDTAAAEDLTQDAFLRALGGDYRADGQKRAWIFQIARNLARDYLRARRRRPILTELFERPAEGGDPSLAFDVNAAIERLGDEDREVFLLREIGGLSYVEIAKVCESSADAVRARLHRTRLSLREELSHPVSLEPRRHAR